MMIQIKNNFIIESKKYRMDFINTLLDIIKKFQF